MEILIDKISETRQERLLNPQMSDHYRTWFQGKYGMKLYDIKVGRKWVFIRSKSHRARLPLAKFKTQAFVQWHCDARSPNHGIHVKPKRKPRVSRQYIQFKALNNLGGTPGLLAQRKFFGRIRRIGSYGRSDRQQASEIA